MSISNKQNIIQSALDLFVTNGYHFTSTNQIIAVAKTSKGALFYHFKDKEEIAVAVLRYYYHQTLKKPLEEILKKSKDPQQGLLEFIDLIYDEFAKYDFVGGCLLGNFALEISDTSKRLTQLTRELFLDWEGIITDYLSELSEPQKLAKFIIWGIQGVTLTGKLFKNFAT